MKYIVEIEFTFLVGASEICSWISVNCDLHETCAENRDPRQIKGSPGPGFVGSKTRDPVSAGSKIRDPESAGSKIRDPGSAGSKNRDLHDLKSGIQDPQHLSFDVLFSSLSTSSFFFSLLFQT